MSLYEKYLLMILAVTSITAISGAMLIRAAYRVNSADRSKLGKEVSEKRKELRLAGGNVLIAVAVALGGMGLTEFFRPNEKDSDRQSLLASLSLSPSLSSDKACLDRWF